MFVKYWVYDWFVARLVIVVSFPQRVDESYDAAGEDPSQATEEFDSEQLASEGKPTFKTQPDVLHFTFFIPCIYYHVFTILVPLHSGWDYCSCIRTKIHPLFYLSGDSELEQLRWMWLLICLCYPSTCTCSYRGIVGLKLPRPTLRIRLCETSCHA